MSSPIEAPHHSRPIQVAYRLTIEDIGRFVGTEDLRCWTCLVRSQKASTALLVGLVIGLSTLCGLGLGIRSGLTLLGSALVLLGAFGWARGSSARRRACRLARVLGIPCDLRVAISARGIVKASGPRLDEPARRFPWTDVVAVYLAPGLIVFRLRPVDAVLLVPNRAFPNAEAKRAFCGEVRRWREASLESGGSKS